MIIRELLTRWGFTVDDKKVEAFEQKLGSTVKTAAAVGAIATAAAASLFALAQNAATAGDEAAKTARNIGISAEALQELRHAAGLSGLGADALTNSLRDLQKNSAAAAKGDEGLSKAFRQLGIDAKKFSGLTADQKLEQIADGMQRVKDPAQAAALRMKILGEGGFKMASLLAGGSAGIKTMREEARQLGIVMDEDTTVAAEGMNDALDRVRAIARGVGLQLGAKLIPMITDAATAVKEWMLANREVIASGLEAAVDGATWAFGLLWETLKTVVKAASWLVEKMGGLNRVLFFTKFLLATFVTYKAGAALWGLIGTIQAAAAAYSTMGAAAAWAQVKAFALPIALAALIVIVGLLVDDFDAFFNGQNSAIGELVKKYPELGGFIWALHDAWVEAGVVAEEFFTDFLEAWPEFKDMVWDAIFSIIDGFNDLEAQIPAAFERAKARALEIVDELVRSIAMKMAAVVGKIELVAGKIGLDTGELSAARMGFEAVGTMRAAPASMRDASTGSAAAARARAPGNGTTTIEGDTFNVTQQPGEDGVVFARRVQDQVDARRASQLRKAAASTDSGVAY